MIISRISSKNEPTGIAKTMVIAGVQLFSWIPQSDAAADNLLAGPILFWTDEFGYSHSGEGDDYGDGANW